MKQENFDWFFTRNDRRAIERDIDNANEFDDENVNIVISVIPDNYEYGYGRDTDFVYDSIEEFLEKGRGDVLEVYELEDIVEIDLYLDFWSDDKPNDVSSVEIDSIK